MITDTDFGRAYLTEGWARRFLVDLFPSFTVLFVGYSHDDTIMNYLARALPVGEADQRFVLISETENDADRWRLLGIEPISYPQADENDYSALYEGVRRMAEHIRRNVLDWQREITEIAEKPPPLDEESIDLIEDETKTRFFTKAASDPKWIDWLDKRGLLNALFGDGTLSERDQDLSCWLADRFTYDHADKLFLLIGKHNMHLNPHFWSALGWTIGREEPPQDKDILSRWISLLLATIQGDVSIDMSLLWMGERCIKHGMLDSLLQVFDTMAGNRLLIKEGIFWDRDNESPPVDVELPLIGEDYQFVELWTDGLKPKLSQVSESLLERVVKRLKERYLTLHAWQKANREWDRESYSRSAIEPHEQNDYLYPVDVLIDAARDCLEWLASNRVETAARWCDRLVESDAPLLRRLAVHGVSKRDDQSADEKIDWLLTHIGLHDLCAHHEIFRAVRKVYPGASPQYRKSLIKAVWAYRWRNNEDTKRERRTAYKHFAWFDWLHKSDPNCGLAKQALDKVLEKYPKFESSKHPDLIRWFEEGPVESQSPWTVEELLAKPAADWLDDLLSFQGSEWDGPSRSGLMSNVAEAVKQNFDWSLELADALARYGEWDVDLWSVLIRSWSEMELDEDKHSQVLHWLGKTNLYPEHKHLIADTLYALVKGDSTTYALNLLPQANKIATALWHHLDCNGEEKNDWLHQAINHPAGILAQFWVLGFSLWRKQQDPEPTTFSPEYCQVLSDIVQDQKLPGKLGRTVFASHFAFLLAVDEEWTRENLLPLFDPDNSDFQAAWDGFLAWGRLSPAVAEVMADLFFKAIERINSDLSYQCRRFIEYYTGMLVHFVEEDPFDKWIPRLFQFGGQEAGKEFAFNLRHYLRNMNGTTQQELWQRWLKQYWENRLQGVPAALESDEIGNMLNWLPHLTAVFPEAVDLVVKIHMPQDISLQNRRVIYEINKSDLWKHYPDAVAKLLIYLYEYNLPNYTWVSGRELIDKLLKQDILLEHKKELKEIKAQL